MYDRIKFPAQGLLGGKPGAAGSFVLSDGRSANPKELLFHPPATRVETALPGGGGFGDPLQRDPAAVLDDVINGYVSCEAAERDYGVVIRCQRRPDELVSLPEHYTLDPAATAALRRVRSSGEPATSGPSRPPQPRP
jgi:N-methylhydantoinase B